MGAVTLGASTWLQLSPSYTSQYRALICVIPLSGVLKMAARKAEEQSGVMSSSKREGPTRLVGPSPGMAMSGLGGIGLCYNHPPTICGVGCSERMQSLVEQAVEDAARVGDGFALPAMIARVCQGR